MDQGQLISKLVKKCETNDPSKIAAFLGIRVVYGDLGKNTWGYYTLINRIPSIHINHRLDEFQSKFALCHELGHHILHPGVNTPFLKRNTLFSIDRFEREANRFAVGLIISGSKPEQEETTREFLLRCGLHEEFHIFY